MPAPLCPYFDDEVSHLLLQQKLPVVLLVGGPLIELIPIATGGRILPGFEELTADKLETDTCSCMKPASVRRRKGCSSTKVRKRKGSNHFNLWRQHNAYCRGHDAHCIIYSFIRDSRIVSIWWRGGIPSISCSLAVAKEADLQPKNFL